MRTSTGYTRGRALLVLLLPLIALPTLYSRAGHAYSDSRTFPETGKTVEGRFLAYWDEHGGLAQQGFPISSEMQERSDTDGKTYTVQYFERAVFELHPENRPPNDVLLSLLGNFLYKQKYANGAPNQQPNNSAGSVLFRETGKRLGGVFLDYWQSHGALPQQGFPISDEFMERSDLDGKTYRVQYFERAVFELHPENQPPYNVLLSQLGTFQHRARYQQAAPTQAVRATATTARPSATPVPPTPAPNPTADDYGVTEVKLTLIEWAIVPARVEIEAGRTRFVVSNDSPGEHNLKVRNASGAELGGTPEFVRREGPKTFELDLQPGTYQMLCSLRGHAELGQIGTIVVK
jgi:plastocyanin